MSDDEVTLPAGLLDRLAAASWKNEITDAGSGALTAAWRAIFEHIDQAPDVIAVGFALPDPAPIGSPQLDAGFGGVS